jgi:hypothetical protein
MMPVRAGQMGTWVIGSAYFAGLGFVNCFHAYLTIYLDSQYNYW